jgi:membrane protein
VMPPKTETMSASTNEKAAMLNALNLIWRIKPRESSAAAFWRIVKGRLFSFCLVLGIGFLLIVSLALSTAVAAVGRFFTALLPGPEMLLHALSAVVSVAIFTVLFGMMFKVLPDTSIAWRHVWMGAFVTALLFTIGKVGIGLYLGKTGVASAYGAASSLAVILLWVYYSAMILFFGAEYTYVSTKMSNTNLGTAIDHAPGMNTGRLVS